MGRITGSWERPIQGVSQQTDKDRINGQCTLQENFIPSPLYGLIKRIGTRHIKRMSDSFHPDSLWYSYSRGTDEIYLVVVEPNSNPRVFDLSGKERIVNVTGGDSSYYRVSNPSKSLRMSTIADYSFILNTSRLVKVKDTKTPTNPNMAIVYCQFATYGRDYEVYVDDVLIAKFTTPDGSSAPMVNEVKTNYVIEQLAKGIPPQPASMTKDTNPIDAFTVEIHGNTMYLTKKDGSPFNISTVDSADGNDLVAIQDSVPQLSNLPPYAPIDYVVKIQNKEGFDAASFWLKAEAQKEGEKTGSRVRWVETNAPNTTYMFDEKTMPHTLISEADGTFTLDCGEWKERCSGNDDTNPFPSFVDNPVKSIGTFQNRMLFTSNEAAIFSRTNNFFDFFRETTQEESDSDPIDAYADSDEINNLLHHAVLDGDIVFFAENGQFLISGSKPITKETIIFKKVTSYPMNTEAKPAVTGESVMFAFNSGSYTGIREMFTDSFTDTKRARPITEHVSEYIKGSASRLVASPNFNTLLIQTPIDLGVLYIYDWLWNGDQKVQSAFHKWIFDGNVLYASFFEDELYFVISRDSGVYLEVMPISSDADDNGLDFPVRLDQRGVVTATYTNNRWEWACPYPITHTEDYEFVRGEGCWDADKGTSVIFEESGCLFYSYDDLADWQGGVTTCKLTVGRKFPSRYIPTQPFLKDGNGRVMGLDRFTLGQVYLNYESIGSIMVKVHDKFSKREWRYEYNGRRMGGWNNRVGFAPLDSGQFAFPIRLPSDRVSFEVITDDYRPFVLRDMEWSGMFKQRGRRL